MASKKVATVDGQLAKATGPAQDALVDQLVNGVIADELPVTVYGYTVTGAYFGPSIGCVEFWPTGRLDLVGLCLGP
jgi:hypothetical protein